MKPSEIHAGASALHVLVCIALWHSAQILTDRGLGGDIGAAAVLSALVIAAIGGLRLQVSLALIATARLFSRVGLPGARALATAARRIAPTALKASAASLTAVVFASSAAQASPMWGAHAPEVSIEHSAETPTVDPSWPTQAPQPPEDTTTQTAKPQTSPTRQEEPRQRAPEKPQPRTVTVKKGDCLWTIAMAHPDSSMTTAERVQAIVSANPDTISNPDLIYPNTELELP